MEGNPYVDPRTGVLFNKLGITDFDELQDAERRLVLQRSMSVREVGIPPTGDLAELKAIHKHLFQDVYEWAGELRVTNIKKAHGQDVPFTDYRKIELAARYCAQELREDRYLKNLPRDVFVRRLAHHYDQLNQLHPFREGNGRTLRAMLDRVVEDAGYLVRWDKVTGARNDQACRAARELGEMKPLYGMFDDCVELLNEAPPEGQRRVERVPLYVDYSDGYYSDEGLEL